MIKYAGIKKIPSDAIASYATANHAATEEPLASEEGLCSVRVTDITMHVIEWWELQQIHWIRYATSQTYVNRFQYKQH